MNEPATRSDIGGNGGDGEASDSSLEDRAYDALLTWLVQGRVRAGEPVPLREFARQLGMSRTPLRAAVGRLQAQGVVAYSPRLGFTVRSPSAADLHELFDLRLMCELHGLRRFLGAPNAGLPEPVARLADETRALADRIVEAPALITAYYELDFRFHRDLLALGGNRRLLDWYDQLGFSIHIVRAGIATPITRDRFSTSAADHLALVADIAAGRADAALAVLERHIVEARDQTIERASGVSPPAGASSPVWLDRIARETGAHAASSPLAERSRS